MVASGRLVSSASKSVSGPATSVTSMGLSDPPASSPPSQVMNLSLNSPILLLRSTWATQKGTSFYAQSETPGSTFVIQCAHEDISEEDLHLVQGSGSLDLFCEETCDAPLTPLVLSLCHGIEVQHPPQDMASAL
ncbi:hypothetical protein E2C01_048640 [Portunus trituberculatus]|uniref:Uncharacterized protein n=1 Tax=Portunus trituberculatus TaxID=210409 RepID=A0A5B7GDY9_PORTR|nr:hypothetical protein [Portunus trituberculatus]